LLAFFTLARLCASEPSMSLYLQYARRGRNSGWRYGLVVASAVLLTFVIPTLIATPLIMTGALQAADVRNMLNPVHPVAFFLGNGAVFAAMIASFAVMAFVLQKKTPLDLVGAWDWRLFGLGLGLWSLCLCVASIADFVLRPQGFQWSATGQTPVLALSALFGLGVQAFAEEYVFRGYLTQGLLLAVKRPLPTALASGLIFGLMHIPNGWPQFANATLFGVLTALIAMRTGGLAFTYGLHLINNLFGAVVVVSADDVFKGAPGLFTQHTPGLLWWDVVFGVALLAVPAWFALKRPIALAPEGDPSALD
jgi:membrane protease YdiL (CAAX protease family)